MTVDTWYECSFAIEKREEEQVKKSYNYMNTLAENAAKQCAFAYEDAIIALFSGFSQTTGTSAAGVADSNIRRAIQYLDQANVPQEDRAFFMSPKAVWTDLMAIDKFTLVQNAPSSDPVNKGFVGRLYGIPVYVTSRIATTLGSAKNCLAHKDAIVHASSRMATEANYIPQYKATLWSSDVVFGAIENRDTSGVWIKTAAA